MFKKTALLVLVIVMLSGAAIDTPAYASRSGTVAQTIEEPTAQAPEAEPEVLAGSVTGPKALAAQRTETDFFTETGEEVKEDAKKGYWLYRSPTLFVEINRTKEPGPNVCFVAEIRLKEGEKERAGFANSKKPGSSRRWLDQIAKDYQAVIAVNADYMNRVKRKGMIIRDGKTYLNKKNADTLAFYPDGSLRIIRPGKKTPAQLLADGVRNTFSFGPTLINNGKIEPNLHKHRLRSKNPRTAIGMVEPGHYILIVVNGRQKKYSVGMTLKELAALFARYDCKVAYNLDGGRSSVMCFMGKHISYPGGSLKGQRKVPDALMFGKTRLVK